MSLNDNGRRVSRRRVLRSAGAAGTTVGLGAVTPVAGRDGNRGNGGSDDLVFGEQTYVDTRRAGGEPTVEMHPDGTLLYGAHAGTTHFYAPETVDQDSSAFANNYEGQAYYWYSDDLGENWYFVERTTPPDGVPGSGFSDPAFAIDMAGNVYISEINLVNVAVSKSTDSGRSYELQNFFAFTQSDRQWMAADEEDVLYMTANGFGGGSTPTDPIGELDHFIAKSVDGGVTWGPAQTPNTDGVADIQVDPRDGTLYEITATSSGTISMAAYRGIRDLAPDDDFSEVLEHHTIVEGVGLTPIGRLIDPTFDMDDEGNLYITWSDNGTGSRDAGIYYSYSTDRGRTWAEPVRVDPNANAVAWPWLAVGDPGEVAIVYLQTDTELENNNAELADDDDVWTVDVAWTEHGLGCDGAPTPDFRIQQASAEHVHSGTICQGGTLCQAQLVDRRLGDYFANEVDLDGEIHISVSDTRQGGAVALPLHIRQVGGPPLTDGATPPSTTSPPQPAPEPEDRGAMPATGGGLALAGIGLLSLAGIGSWARRRRGT